MEFSDVVNPIAEKISSTADQYGIDVNQWQKPFVFLNGRKDFSVTIYAVNIYPENIKAALIDQTVREFVTGRFTMATQNYSDMDQYFEINVELAKDFDASAGHRAAVEHIILEKLLSLNTEFHKLHAAIGAKAIPQVHLVKFGDADYFARGVKHKWVKKG
jgi:phenylacetate-CoA ligase